MATGIFGIDLWDAEAPETSGYDKARQVSIIKSHRRVSMRVSEHVSFRTVFRGVLAFGLFLAATTARAPAAESYAIAMHGAPALPADFTHMPYANPDAPKGGRLVQGLLGSFDSLNPLIVNGVAVQQVRGYGFERGYVLESLMTRGNDEPFTLYGLLARSVETDERQELRHLPSRPAGAFLRRATGARRRRAVFLRVAARPWPPEPSPVLFQSRKGRGARSTHGAVRFWRRRRP